MRILVMYGDYYHPGEAAKAGLNLLAKEGFEFDWLEDASEWSAETMAEYPLVLLTKSNHLTHTTQDPWMTLEVELAFRDYVRQGNSLLAVHSGAAGYANTTIFKELLGGMFNHHPAQCQVTVEPHSDHPLTEAIESFTVFDEHYFMDMAAGNHIFLTTHSEHGAQPGGWTRTEGAGRVCVLTPGHNPEVWIQPDYQAILKRTLTTLLSK